MKATTCTVSSARAH